MDNRPDVMVNYHSSAHKVMKGHMKRKDWHWFYWVRHPSFRVLPSWNVLLMDIALMFIHMGDPGTFNVNYIQTVRTARHDTMSQKILLLNTLQPVLLSNKWDSYTLTSLTMTGLGTHVYMFSLPSSDCLGRRPPLLLSKFFVDTPSFSWNFFSPPLISTRSPLQ